jgi:hypothetical protein
MINQLIKHRDRMLPVSIGIVYVWFVRDIEQLIATLQYSQRLFQRATIEADFF